ncbi:ATP-dependent DNA helicase [Microcoleus sp. FACHB-831]|uniref:ATP-dependent DNA helicase n=1 Tax=Microcoleus sp. FACHB-831 TaxID=2692827 RepID=UPI0028162281|nr:ATP-dependent DNA helicase [Microcoleus sp. FACHB-831]
MIEVEVHSALLAYLRFVKNNKDLTTPSSEKAVELGCAEEPTLRRSLLNVPIWPHHLTMARLVARAFRLGRSALIQTGIPLGDVQSGYRLSYLLPALIWPGPIILVVSEAVQQHLQKVEIPPLLQWLQKYKDVQTGDRWPNEDFQGVLLMSPDVWIANKLHGQDGIPTNVPTIIDGADDLEGLARETLTARLSASDWEELMRCRSDQADAIRDARVQLTHLVFQHPANPYECYLIEPSEQDILRRLYKELTLKGLEPNLSSDVLADLPPAWRNFWQRWQTDGKSIIWASIDRSGGTFSLCCSPVEVATALSKIWTQQPIVLIGGALDMEGSASVYQTELGLADSTLIKFSPDRRSELIQLYVPDKLAMPNTPEFQEVLIKQILTLLSFSDDLKRPVVLLIGDTPLKAQVGAVLAASFGSRVQVEKTSLSQRGILVTGWEFWRQHLLTIPPPQLLAIATLPIPSLENPLVAARVAYYKQRRLDWFRLYLLPVALRELQRAIAPVRESQGVVALFDGRVNHRSYGTLVLSALSPLARINYLDPNWLRDRS